MDLPRLLPEGSVHCGPVAGAAPLYASLCSHDGFATRTKHGYSCFEDLRSDQLRHRAVLLMRVGLLHVKDLRRLLPDTVAGTGAVECVCHSHNLTHARENRTRYVYRIETIHIGWQN